MGLDVTWIINPDDKTLAALNAELLKPQTGYYVWHTVHDDHVRAGHAVFDGTIRNWEDFPDPGEDFNCRCWAEPVPKNANNKKWDNIDFINHFYNGDGQEIDLKKAGLLPDVIDRSNKIIVPRITNQISEIVTKIKGEKFEYKTENVYDFKPVLFSLGKSTVTTKTTATIKKEKNSLTISGLIHFQLVDEFTDPLSIREIILNRSSQMKKTLPKDKWAEIGGAPYKIKGNWDSPFTINIRKTN